MGYKKIPLAEQLERAGKYRVHPEHDACAVRAFGEMPLSGYMKGEYAGRLGKMPVRETAQLIGRHKRPGAGVLPHKELLRLFAAPMGEAYRVWKEAQDAEKEKT